MFGSRSPDPPVLKGLPRGQAGEEWAAFLYRQKGHEILARNFTVFWQKKIGEIDIVTAWSHTIHIVEVKTRTSESFMPLEQTVNFRKQQYLRRMAKLYIQNHPEYEGWDLQIDVVVVLMDPFDNIVKSAKLMENVIEDD